MGKSTISMAIFQFAMFVYQRIDLHNSEDHQALMPLSEAMGYTESYRCWKLIISRTYNADGSHASNKRSPVWRHRF